MGPGRGQCRWERARSALPRPSEPGTLRRVSDRGAPTGVHSALPKHLQDDAAPFDLAAAEAKLVVTRTGLPEVTLPIERPEFLIGRAVEGVDLTLDDDAVSRHHAKLTVNERGYFRLEDLGSTNGVQFEGRRVKRINLVDGDVFVIGDARIRFEAQMNRNLAKPEPRKPAPRLDSVFADVAIPEPHADAEPAEDDDFGWDPEKARAQAMAEAQAHAEAEAPPDGEE